MIFTYDKSNHKNGTTCWRTHSQLRQGKKPNNDTHGMEAHNVT